MAKLQFRIEKEAYALLSYNLFTTTWLNILLFIKKNYFTHVNETTTGQLFDKTYKDIIYEAVGKIKKQMLNTDQKEVIFNITDYIPNIDKWKIYIHNINSKKDWDNFMHIRFLLFLEDTIQIYNNSQYSKLIWLTMKEQKEDLGLTIKIQKIEYTLPPSNALQMEITEINPGPEITDLTIAQKLLNLKKSADDRNIPFSLSFKKLKLLWRQEKCQITGEYFHWIENDSLNPQWKSIDRWDTKKGYSDDNCVVCTQRINKVKTNLTLEDLNNLFIFNQKKLKKK